MKLRKYPVQIASVPQTMVTFFQWNLGKISTRCPSQQTKTISGLEFCCNYTKEKCNKTLERFCLKWWVIDFSMWTILSDNNHILQWHSQYYHYGKKLLKPPLLQGIVWKRLSFRSSGESSNLKRATLWKQLGPKNVFQKRFLTSAQVMISRFAIHLTFPKRLLLRQICCQQHITIENETTPRTVSHEEIQMLKIMRKFLFMSDHLRCIV